VNQSNEIIRLQSIIKKLENELHNCCIEVLDIEDLARKVERRDNSAESVTIAVCDAFSDIYHKYDYRVRGYDYENIILDEIDG
tara:strand:+ start:573 stop:821 length:249 start_codon:yes stop_codon:yes gene_type:complete